MLGLFQNTLWHPLMFYFEIAFVPLLLFFIFVFETRFVVDLKIRSFQSRVEGDAERCCLSILDNEMKHEKTNRVLSGDIFCVRFL